jgi:serine/threonine-protein kinase HipA
MNELVVLLNGKEVGTARQTQGKISFTYAETWRAATDSYPLSISMPLALQEHGHRTVEPFIWGLLPDNDAVLNRWGKQFHVSPRNPFDLIAHVGEDCAGAVQFVRPERRDELLTAAPAATAWLTEHEVAERLRALQEDGSVWRQMRDEGQFSLAGAQPKTALLFDGQRWGVPSGRTPTTHILKPPTGGFDGHAENEHLCLRLANALGFPTAHSEVRQFENVSAIVVTRYDRVWDQRAGLFSRVHQEDFCQALSVHPAIKYQNQGGPGPKQIVDVLRASSGIEDVTMFIDALIFNWLIGGTDAHAKNYSLLIGSGGVVRLAPLYDVASIFAYPEIDQRKVKLAMKIGDEYKIHAIGLSDWRKFAESVRVDGDALIERIRGMARELPDRLSDEVAVMRGSGLTHGIIDVLSTVLVERAGRVALL